MALQHFSHEHPLVLNEKTGDNNNNNIAGEEILCNGCQKPIIPGSSAYSCCNTPDACQHFFLHKTCAELPKEIKHLMHPEHTLTLLAVPPYNSKTFACNICRYQSPGFTYNCSLCEFDVDLNCAFQECSFRHEAHHHELTLIQKPASFCCDACNSKAEDLSYHCTICPFWMHKSCAASTKTIYPSFHNHPLTLSYFIPKLYRTFKQFCYICKRRINPQDWLYMCVGCRIFTHIKCATLTTAEDSTSAEPMMLRDGKSENEVDYERRFDPNLVNFPVPDESSVDLRMHQFVKGITIKAGHKTQEGIHKDHPLLLLDRHHPKKDKILICDVCVTHISPEDPYYACFLCNFFLHKFCIELPLEMKHSFHPQHPLHLYSPTNPLCYLECDNCHLVSSGCFYVCEPCNFWLDLRCATLPTTIKHEAHTHPLILNKLLDEKPYYPCNACDYSFHNMEYRCEACHFHLHTECATRLPAMIRHKWDDHPILLVYGQIQDHPEVFYCEICEEEINPYFWLYFCRECDQSFHPRCLYPMDEYGNVKFGSKHKFDSHLHKLTFVHSTGEFLRYPHSLTLIPKSANNKYPRLCNSCGEAQIEVPVLECAPCKFLLCMTCAYRSIGVL